ncbi:MAG: sensor histidine kinase, partial [Flavobacteriaceae bacterium]
EQELKEINETKNKLFSVIAHDLRGPIAAFEGLLKLFREREIGEKEFLGFVPKLSIDIENISFALNNLLSWGQSQMNGAVTKPDVTPLYNLVIENVNLLSEIAKQKSIKIINLVEENAYAWSDRDQINIVIRNLISNALKFTPERGMVTIRSIERNDLWEISIRDTGVGMNRETVDKLFQNGGTYTSYGTNNEKGTGIGLSICKEMVEKNNGTIWVDSIPKKGSCFYFTVPKTDKDTYQNLNTPIGAATA